MSALFEPGAGFLAFYAILAIASIGALLALYFRAGRSAPEAKVTDLTGDPYGIAYLRGGRSETLRVALFNLVDRGLLTYENGLVNARADAQLATLRRPLDKLMVRVAKGATVNSLLSNPALQREAEAYARVLSSRGLVSDGAEWNLRRAAGWSVVGLLGGVGLVRLINGIAHARPIWVLVLATVASVCVAAVVARQRRTRMGSAMLRNLRNLLSRLSVGASRIRAGGATNEALLLAAIFGLAALPVGEFAIVRELFPKPQMEYEMSGDSSCSTSCSSGCGGGGGCGGCGGCGGE